MSCDGVNEVESEKRPKSKEAVESPTTGDLPARNNRFPPETGFRGFISIPHVRLERYDITPYLNGHKLHVTKEENKKNRGKNYAIHKRKLSQKCLVKVKRDDLDKLLASLRNRSEVPLSPDSDSDSSIATDMAIKCQICGKAYNSDKKLLKHQQNKHIIYTTPNTKAQKRVSFSDHVIVHEVKEYHKCQKVEEIYPTQYIDLTDMNMSEGNTINVNTLRKAIIDPKSKKTLLSKHQCQTCGKYYSNSYCLSRHIASQHEDFENLQCKVCEETFVWPSLLKSHKCIRLNLPEMPFDDARAEIHFDNSNTQQGFDDLNIEENDDYMNTVDFEIPAPIVELRECDSTFMANNVVQNVYNLPDKNGVTSSGYTLVMHEVPIEF